MFNKKESIKETDDKERKIVCLQQQLKEVRAELSEVKMVKFKQLLKRYIDSVYVIDNRTNESALELGGGVMTIGLRNGISFAGDTTLVINFKEGYSIEFVVK